MTHQSANFTMKNMAISGGAIAAGRGRLLGLVGLILALILPAAHCHGLQAGHLATAPF
ncbi:MAG: hypothetical protein IT209_01905 [Armatimonadetes bacterium]|nr:hypothetical protein [Armatimonadota bacterium]